MKMIIADIMLTGILIFVVILLYSLVPMLRNSKTYVNSDKLDKLVETKRILRFTGIDTTPPSTDIAYVPILFGWLGYRDIDGILSNDEMEYVVKRINEQDNKKREERRKKLGL